MLTDLRTDIDVRSRTSGEQRRFSPGQVVQLRRDPAADFPVLHDLKEEGATDYIALPLQGPSRRRIASGVAFAQADAAAHAIYYTASSGEGLYRFDLSSGERRFVTPKVSSVTTLGWRVVDGHIWYLTGVEVKPVVLRDLDPATGEEHELKRFDIALKDVNFSITPNRDAIVLAEIGAEDTDVGMFTLTRAATH